MVTGESVMAIVEGLATAAGIALGGAGLDGGSSGVIEAMIGGGIRVAAMLLLLMGIVLSMRGASAAARHAVWRAGFVVALLMPVVAVAMPWRLELLPGRVEVAQSGGPSMALAHRDGQVGSLIEDAPWVPQAESKVAAASGLGAGPGGESHPPAQSGDMTLALRETSSASAERGGLDPSSVGLLVWLAGTLLLGVRLLIGHGAVRRIVRGGRRLTGSEWTSPLYEAADILDVEVDVDLVASDRITMPFTAGLRRPAIVLPESACGWDGERRRAVLMHELAHVQRRDLFSHHVARWVCALHWFNPLAWAGARRMRADSERAADDLVLNAGTRASDYADHLLQIVSSAGRSMMPAPALPLAQRREFEGRMLAILEPGIRRRGPGRMQSLAVTALVLLMTLPLAAVGRAEATVATAVEPPRESSERAGATDAGSFDRDHDEDHDHAVDESAAVGMSEWLGPQLEAPQPMQPPQPKQGFFEDLIGGALGIAMPFAGKAAQEALEAVEAVVPALVETLGDHDLEVRQAAVAALSNMGDPRAVQALMRILRDDAVDDVRAAAAFALGEIEDPAAVPALAEALRTDRSAEVRKNAAWALGQIEDARAVEALGAALNDADAEVRHMSMWALGEIESPAAVPALIAALSSGDAEVRHTAAWALGQIEDARAVEGLTLALRSEDAQLREAAAWALGEIESPAAVAALGRLVRDPAASVRAAVVHALAAIEDPASAPALTGALADESHDVRAMAAYALGELSLSVAPPALIQALRDPHADVRAAAAHALAEIGDPAAIDALTAALDDGVDDVRMAAIHALLEMDSDAGTDALLQLLDHEDPQVRKHAAEALGRN